MLITCLQSSVDLPLVAVVEVDASVIVTMTAVEEATVAAMTMAAEAEAATVVLVMATVKTEAMAAIVTTTAAVASIAMRLATTAILAAAAMKAVAVTVVAEDTTTSVPRHQLVAAQEDTATRCLPAKPIVVVAGPMMTVVTTTATPDRFKADPFRTKTVLRSCSYSPGQDNHYGIFPYHLVTLHFSISCESV
jgi:hypothetical protein